MIFIWTHVLHSSRFDSRVPQSLRYLEKVHLASNQQGAVSSMSARRCYRPRNCGTSWDLEEMQLRERIRHNLLIRYQYRRRRFHHQPVRFHRVVGIHHEDSGRKILIPDSPRILVTPH